MSILNWNKKKQDKTDKKPMKDGAVKESQKAAASMKDLYGSSQPVREKGKTGQDKRVKPNGQAYRILLKPLVTEKAAQASAANQYMFAVAPHANKIEVGRAVEEIYGIKPVSVNMVRVLGKEVRYGRRRGQRKDWKKAIVKLPAGKTINLYEGV
jgi:large subunit ribosomal protein L23